MRETKNAAVRRNEILDAAQVLFGQKGFEETSTSDILEKVGIARGTLYYHFQSKEDILDALIERSGEQALAAARKIAGDKTVPVLERMVQTVLALNIHDNGGEEMVAQMHKPKNALMHQKTQQLVIREVPGILAEVVQEGIDQRLFETPYPYECTEMIVVYANTVFDEGILVLPKEARAQRIQAFFFNLERLLGAAPGSLAALDKMFEHGR